MQMRRTGLLLQDLEDPFALFPLESVARSLQQLVAGADESMLARMGPSGRSRKYWDVPTELLHDEIGLLLGASFVLGQATLTQSVAIINAIRTTNGVTSSLPSTKSEVLNLEAEIDTRTQLSHLVVVDTAANYFKHYHEWPVDWSCAGGTPQQRRTIETCIALGMTTGSLTDNMYRALGALQSDQIGALAIQKTIQRWRERLTRRLYSELKLPDPANEGLASAAAASDA